VRRRRGAADFERQQRRYVFVLSVRLCVPRPGGGILPAACRRLLGSFLFFFWGGEVLLVDVPGPVVTFNNALNIKPPRNSFSS